MEVTSARRAAITAALVFALSVFGFTLYFWKSFGGAIPLEPQGYRLKVAFGTEATNLVAGAQVRISGVPVGRVVDTRANRRTVDTVIEIESDYAPVPSDARAIVRSKTLLGENFIELSPGSAEAPKVADEGRLPAGNVHQAQTIDKVLETFDEPTRTAFRRLADGLSAGLAGRGDELNSTLGNAAPVVADLDRLARGARVGGRRPERARARLGAGARGARAARGCFEGGDHLG